MSANLSVEPTTDALTTIDSAQNHMGNTSTAPGDLDRIQRYINAYSRQIRLYTGRTFMPTADNLAVQFRYEGNGFLSLGTLELRSVNAGGVVFYTDLPQLAWRTLNDQTPTQESEYRLEPRRKTLENTYLWLSLPEIGMFSPLVPEPLLNRRARGHEVTITGNWNAGVVPADVELACLIAVANAMRNPEGFASRSLGGFSFSEAAEASLVEDAGRALPRDARALLSEYRRTAFS